MIEIMAEIAEKSVKSKSPEEFEVSMSSGIRLIINDKPAFGGYYIVDDPLCFFQSFFSEIEHILSGRPTCFDSTYYVGTLCLQVSREKVRIIRTEDLRGDDLKKCLVSKLKGLKGRFHYSDGIFIKLKNEQSRYPEIEVISVSRTEFFPAAFEGAEKLVAEIYKINPHLRQSKYMREFERRLKQAKAALKCHQALRNGKARRNRGAT